MAVRLVRKKSPRRRLCRHLSRGRQLSEIGRFLPLITQEEQQHLVQQLENPALPWPAKCGRNFYQIFISDNVTRDEALSGSEVRGGVHP